MLLPVIAHEKGYIFDTHNSTYQAMKSGQLIDIFKGNIFWNYFEQFGELPGYVHSSICQPASITQ